MSEDLNTTALDINSLCSRGVKNSGDISISSGKINPIRDKKELDQIFGGWGKAYAQVSATPKWGQAWGQVGWGLGN